jgi:plastocyanin
MIPPVLPTAAAPLPGLLRRAGTAAAAVAVAMTFACGGSPPAPGGAAAPAPEATPTPSGGGTASAPAGQGGRVAGRVLFKGTPPAAAPIAVTKDHAVCGTVRHTREDLVVAAGGGVRYAVVSIDPAPAAAPSPGAAPRLDQKGCWFIPHVQVVPAGAEIQIVNDDGILHNIHTFSTLNPPINMAQPKFKRVLTHRFERPERIRVACDVHGWMSAWIVVVDHPFHAVTADDGSFALEGVPPGSYRLTVWHETLGTREQPIMVPAGGSVEADFTFGG